MDPETRIGPRHNAPVVFRLSKQALHHAPHGTEISLSQEQYRTSVLSCQFVDKYRGGRDVRTYVLSTTWRATALLPCQYFVSVFLTHDTSRMLKNEPRRVT